MFFFKKKEKKEKKIKNPYHTKYGIGDEVYIVIGAGNPFYERNRYIIEEGKIVKLTIGDSKYVIKHKPLPTYHCALDNTTYTTTERNESEVFSSYKEAYLFIENEYKQKMIDKMKHLKKP